MNYKTLFTLLALCVCLAAPAMAVSAHYESKIVQTEPYAQPSHGILSGSIRCGYNTLTKEVGIKNNLDVNGSYKLFPILADGTLGDIDGSHDIKLIPGTFTLYLTDGNGGQPEYSSVTIRAGQISYPEKELLGHAVSAKTEDEITTPPAPDCHTHRIWIFGHFEYHSNKPHWRWVDGHWYTWKCCLHHCHQD